jgi:hypothetical protein
LIPEDDRHTIITQ